MAEVVIDEKLRERIDKKFKGKSKDIFRLLLSLEDNPHKGKELAQVNGVLIKELRYESFRFYFIVDGYKIKVYDGTNLIPLLIKVIAMSNKKEQQETIDKIKELLKSFGKEALS